MPDEAPFDCRAPTDGDEARLGVPVGGSVIHRQNGRFIDAVDPSAENPHRTHVRSAAKYRMYAIYTAFISNIFCR